MLGESTGEIMSNMWKTYYHKEDIPGAYTFYACYRLTVVICNLGPGHNNEVVGDEDRYAQLET